MINGYNCNYINNIINKVKPKKTKNVVCIQTDEKPASSADSNAR